MQPTMTFIKNETEIPSNNLDFSHDTVPQLTFWSLNLQQTLFLDKIFAFAKEHNLNVILDKGSFWNENGLMIIRIQKNAKKNGQYVVLFKTAFDFQHDYNDKFSLNDPTIELFNRFVKEYTTEITSKENDE